MPALVMRAPANSLLDHTYRLVVARQMSYAAELGVPWGISESAFNARDLAQTYQYSSFGVPGLGLKRGLSEDVVVAPVRDRPRGDDRPRGRGPELRPVEQGRGRRAVRLPGGARLHGAPAPRRRVGRDREELHGPPPGDGAGRPRQRPQRPRHGGALPCRPDRRGDGAAAPGADAARRARGPAACRGGEERRRRARSRAAGPPSLHVAPRRDPADAPAVERAVRGHGDGRGIRLQPLGRRGGDPLARGRDPRLVGQLSLPARHAHRRRVVGGPPAQRHGGGQLRGHLLGGARRVLPSRRLDRDRLDRRRVGGARRGDPPRVADQSRLAGSRDRADLLRGDRSRAAGGRCRSPGLPEPVRADGVRPRDRRPPGDAPPAIQGREADLGRTRRGGRGGDGGGVIQYETDRARFLGRGRSVRSPVSVIDGRPLSNTVGAVLDPIFSLRCRVRLAPGATAHAVFSTVVAESREQVLDLADKYRESATFERAATLAWTQAQVQLHHLGIEPDEAHLFQRLANRILYSDPSLRPAAGLLARNERGAPGLWAHGISGDLPIVMVRIDEARGPRHRSAAAPRARVLAAEAPRRRPRDPQRAWRHLRPGPPRFARGPRADEPVHPGPRWPSEPRRGLHPARRPALDRGPHAPPGRRPGRPAEPPGHTRRPGDPPGASREDGSARPARRLEGDKERGGRAASGARVLQRARWLRRWRARVRHHPRPGTVHPGALAERDRQRRRSGSRSPSPGRATPGPGTAARTSSPRGPTTPSATR